MDDDAFAELDYAMTALGPVSLRRRVEPRTGVQVWEAKLRDEFLMSSLFTVGETALATLCLEALDRGDADVVIGGLGLGYTAAAALEHPRVRSVTIIEVLEPVIGWHRRGLVPMGSRLSTDARVDLVCGDFFAMAMGSSLVPKRPDGLADVILVDIDHSPRHWLSPLSRWFYLPEGLRSVARRLRPGGVFGMWSDDPPDGDLLRDLGEAFAGGAEGRVVTFPNPITGGSGACTIYIAFSSPR